MKRKLRLLSVLIGLVTALGAGTYAATSANAATTSAPAMTLHAATAPASTAVLTAAHPARTVILSASRSAGTVTLGVQTASGQHVVVTMAVGQVIPNGINCYFPTCGWEFSHAQTVALWSTGVAAAVATCHRYLGPVGLTYVCDALAAWLAVHIAPKDNQCLYVSTLPVGVIKYVTC